MAVERNGRWGTGDRGARPGGPEQGRGRRRSSRCRAPRRATARPAGTTGRPRHQQGFVASERNGRWGKAIEVPGLGALNKGGDAERRLGVVRLGGQLRGRRGLHGPAPVTSRGSWPSSRTASGARRSRCPAWAALNTGGDAEVNSVSCASAGNCAAGGYYADRRDHGQGFVADERNGRWGKAIEVPGLGALNTGGHAEVDSVSCASAGNCAAGGDYADRPRPRAGVRGRRAERPLGQGDRGARPGRPEHGRGRQRRARCRAPRRATARPAGTTATAADNFQGFVVSQTG